MLEHLLIADLGALLIVLGLTGPVLRRCCAPARGCGSSGTRSSRSWSGRRTSTSGTCPCSTRARSSNDAVHALQHILFVSFGIGMWMALLGPLPKPAWFGNGCEDRLHHRRPADPERAGQRPAVVERRPVSAVRARRGLLGHHRRQRPERGGRDHDDRGLDRHDPALLLAVPEGRARERGGAGAGGAGGVTRRRASAREAARRPREPRAAPSPRRARRRRCASGCPVPGERGARAQ